MRCRIWGQRGESGFAAFGVCAAFNLGYAINVESDTGYTVSMALPECYVDFHVLSFEVVGY